MRADLGVDFIFFISTDCCYQNILDKTDSNFDKIRAISRRVLVAGATKGLHPDVGR